MRYIVEPGAIGNRSADFPGAGFHWYGFTATKKAIFTDLDRPAHQISSRESYYEFEIDSQLADGWRRVCFLKENVRVARI